MENISPEDRTIRLEIVVDALVEALIAKGHVTRQEIQAKILELSGDNLDAKDVK